MSDNYLRIVPVDPAFIPAPSAAEFALEIVRRSLPDADEVQAVSYAHPTFIDQGINFEKIICPGCRSRLSVSGGRETARTDDWWLDVSRKVDRTHLIGALVVMPCCGSSVAFETISYDWPAAVASFEISVLNPGVSRGLSDALTTGIERALGCLVTEIWAHY
jgi:hypothetical protein